jgi:hypothetical protein
MFKTCPECGGEFQAWVTRCPDCDVALVIAGEEVARPAPRELPHAGELVCVERGDPWHLRELAERLQQQGISCRIDVYPPDAAIRPPARRAAGTSTTGTQFGLYVRAEDVALAQQLRSEHLAEVVPGAQALAGEVGGVLSDCPACGTPLAEGAGSCASCGLEFPEQGGDG